MLVTRSGLVDDLGKLGIGVGGAEVVVRALFDALGPGGTLVAYTGWQDAPPDDIDALDGEERRAYLEEQPVYDPRVALTRRDHGRVPELLRTWPGTLHSGHPEAGVAAVGTLAGEIVASHPYDDAYGGGTPYARLVELGGQVAMLGAPLDTVTLVHHAEAIAEVPNKCRVVYRYPVLEGGERVWRTFSDIDTSDGALPYERLIGGEDYVGYLAGSALAAGCGTSGPVGEATAYLFDAPQLVEHAVGWIEHNFPSVAPEYR